MTHSSAPAQQIRALLHTQCETIKAQIGELERLAALLTGAAGDEDLLQALIHTAHRIAGTGGSFGFDGISQKAFALETFAKQLLRKAPGAQKDGVSMVRTLTRSLASAGAGLTPNQSRLRQRLLMRGGARFG